MAAKSLADFKNALAETDVELTVTSAASGREPTRPVWFPAPREGLVLKMPGIRLAANDVAISAMARPITDPRRVRDVVDKFREKYGADEVKKYYSKLDVAVEVPLNWPS